MAILRILPGIQKARYRPVPVNPRTVSRTSRELFKEHPLLVYTGPNRPFEQNRQIGKSKSSEHIFLSMLNRGHRAEYRDVKQALRMDNRSTTRPDLVNFHDELVCYLPEADFYILDEFHHAFPRDPNVTGLGPWGIPIFRGEQYNNAMFAFWLKLSELKEQGRKFLMITALHPQQPEYLDFLSDTSLPMMAEFFLAPVLELSLTVQD